LQKACGYLLTTLSICVKHISEFEIENNLYRRIHSRSENDIGEDKFDQPIQKNNNLY